MCAAKIKLKFDCDDVEEKVQAYLDGCLSSKEVILFEEHLDYCLPCDKKIEFEKKLKEVIKVKGAEKTCPEHLKATLKKIIRKRDPS